VLNVNVLRRSVCKHRPVHEIENKLYPDYNDGLFQRMYIELEEEV
jgi:hypothetical protein